MKNTSRLMPVILAALVAGLVLVPPGAFSAPRLPAKAPAAIAPAPEADRGEIVLRIRDAAGLINLAESMTEGSEGAPKGPLRNALEQKLGGLDWLDEKRSVVVIASVPIAGAEAGGPFNLVGLAPFMRKSEKFRAAFSAIEGKGYYLFTHPAGSVIKKATIARLLAASKAKCPDMLALEIPVSELASGFLEHGFEAVERSAREAEKKDPDAKSRMSARQSTEIARGLLEFQRDVKTVSIGVNASEEKCSLRFSAVPVQGSALAKALAGAGKSGGKSLLAGYRPEGPITFRTQDFNYDPFMRIFKDLYAKAGIDLSCDLENMASYTGENASGVAYEKRGPSVEGMMVLKKDGESLDRLIAKMIECTARLNSSLESDLPPAKAVRSHDSTVAGRKATGFFMFLSKGKELAVRAALSGRILVLAPDDKRLAELLAQADRMKPGKASGPLMEGRMDIAAIVRGATLMEGAEAGEVTRVTGPAPVNFIFDIKEGVAESLFWAEMKEMKAFFSQIEKAAKAKAIKDPEDSWSDIEEDGEDEGEGSHDGHGNGDGNLDGKSWDDEAPDQTAVLKPGADELDPRAAALLERGNLALVYGSPEQAIRYFSKALKMDPESGQVHSALATAYAEAGRFDRAFFHIEKALEIVPENPDYLYGRARIFLLSGDENKARKGFEEAAARGSDDARRFLERMQEKR